MNELTSFLYTNSWIGNNTGRRKP